MTVRLASEHRIFEILQPGILGHMIIEGLIEPPRNYWSAELKQENKLGYGRFFEPEEL